MAERTKRGIKSTTAVNKSDIASSSTQLAETGNDSTSTQRANARTALTVKEAYDKVYAAGDKVSELNRQFAFAGIAVIWVFKTGDGAEQSIPISLIMPGLLLVLSLLLDLVHHFYKSEIPLRFIQRYERAGDTTVRFPMWMGKWSDALFYAKTAPTLLAYVCLIVYLLNSFLFPPIPTIKTPTESSTGLMSNCAKQWG